MGNINADMATGFCQHGQQELYRLSLVWALGPRLQEALLQAYTRTEVKVYPSKKVYATPRSKKRKTFDIFVP